MGPSACKSVLLSCLEPGSTHGLHCARRVATVPPRERHAPSQEAAIRRPRGHSSPVGIKTKLRGRARESLLPLVFVSLAEALSSPQGHLEKGKCLFWHHIESSFGAQVLVREIEHDRPGRVMPQSNGRRCGRHRRVLVTRENHNLMAKPRACARLSEGCSLGISDNSVLKCNFSHSRSLSY